MKTTTTNKTTNAMEGCTWKDHDSLEWANQSLSATNYIVELRNLLS